MRSREERGEERFRSEEMRDVSEERGVRRARRRGERGVPYTHSTHANREVA
jgi:hypothetical protein